MPNRVLKIGLQSALERQRYLPLSQEAPYYTVCSQSRNVSLTASAADDDYGPQLPNQNLTYAIEFCALPNPGGCPSRHQTPNQNPIYSSVLFGIRSLLMDCSK